MSEPKGSSELDSQEILYVDFVSHFLGNHNSATAYDVNQCGCVNKFMDDSAHTLLKSKLSELLEKKETYESKTHLNTNGSWQTHEAVPISEIQQLLDQLEGDGSE